ncbi:LacI family DNA-binding transcriptional regulator [Rariglobus hedericola]|uniref:LacI family transcriptional regulator n=1 Tax=Rariglobus hedericola TaxID=2597822 RepID=A0A556QSD6_9BACT|nr:LacI family DNA-binding transcriptional regulator [Rariglobus hedericola]TSJ79542.1 LacI family transcriptional regulator [Rariglobus hedericola]
MSNRVTIRDIAAKADVHFTTVALALRDSPRISEARRKSIQKLATKMGYSPDPMLSALNAYRQTRRRPIYQATIAWINNWPERGFLRSNDDFRDYHDGIKERAAELGYEVEEFWMRGKDLSFAKLGRILKARNIQGMILAPQPEPHTEIDFDFSEFSAVSLSYSLRNPALHVVTNHHFRSMLLLMQNLDRLGYRKVGLAVHPSWSEKVGHGWFGGVLTAKELITSGMKILPVKLFGLDDVKAWMKKEQPDVIVSHKQFYEQLLEMGIRMPKDVGFANLSVPSSSPEISGITQNSPHIGRKAVDVLVDMLHRGERGVPDMPLHLLVDGVWVPGKTLRPQKTLSTS